MEKVFLFFLNAGISASWLILTVLVLRLVLRKAPRSFHCALWALVGVRLVWPFSLKSPMSLLPSGETVPPEILYSPAPQIDSGIDAFNAVVNPALAETMSPKIGASVNPMQVAAIVAANIWVLGLAAMLFCALISFWRIRRTVADALPVEGNVYRCGHIATPFILGIFRPRIYLPTVLGEATCVYVLAHERAHLRRRDHWWKPLGFLLLALHWFNPLVWLSYGLLCRDMELACDEQVARDMAVEERKAYSLALLSCSAPRKALFACPLAFGEVGIRQRIRAVLKGKKPAAWLVAMAAVAVVAAAVCFLTDPPAPAAPADSTTAVWTYNPLVSVTWGGVFMFDFDLDYTHIEVSCSSGELWHFDGQTEGEIHTVRTATLETGTTLPWSPCNGSFTNTTNKATVDFTVYADEEKLYTGTIFLTCIRRDGLEATYEARLGDELRLLQAQSNMGARVVTAQAYEELISPGTAITDGVDLNHNGRHESVHVRELDKDQRYELAIVEDGALVWNRVVSTDHAGWNTLCLYREGGKDYLVQYLPTMYQGTGSYVCQVFSLQDVNGTELREIRTEFLLPTAITDEMAAFEEGTNAILEKSAVLLSTEQGQVVIGPVPATELPQIYPVQFISGK